MQLVVDFVTSRQGDRKDSTPGLTISEPGSFPLRRSSQLPLYSLCALDGPSAPEITPVVSQALHDEFSRAAGRSVTSGLTRAVRTAIDTLTRENARSLQQHRCLASLCAAALKGDAMYLAVTGGAGAYVWSNGEIRLVCSSEPNPADAFSEDCEIGLGSARLEQGAAVLLASRGAVRALEVEGVAERLARANHADRLAESLEAILFAATPGLEFSVAVLANPIPVEVAQGELRPERSPSPTPEEQKSRPKDATGVTMPVKAPVGKPTAPPREALRADYPSAPQQRVAAPALPTRPPAGATGAGRAVISSLQRVLLRFSFVAVALAIFAFALYLGEGYFSNQARQVQAAELLATLEQKERDAAAAGDPATRRWLLTEASQAADRALALANPGDEVVAVARRIKGQLDAINGIVRLSGLQLLADFVSLDPAAKPAQILAARDDVYVLDRGVGSVWYLKLGLDLGTLGKPGLVWSVNADSEQASLGEAVAFFWMHVAAPGIPEQVYVLTDGGELVPCSQSEAGTVMRIPAAGALAKIQAAAGQAGNLYVLDNQRRVVWRYTPGPGGYEGAGQAYLTEAAAPELANAVDMAMDGSLYLLLSDGRIVKYAGGQAQTFSAVVPDTPLRKPTGIFTSPATRYVYVADAGNSRVVQFTKEGQYVRQMRAADDTLESLRSASVDESTRRLYAVAGTRAFVAELPAEGKQ